MTCETAVVLCDSQTGQQIGTLSADSIADMEDALDALLEQETPHYCSCTTSHWSQIRGPFFRPSLTVREHGVDVWRLLWARQSGALHDLVVSPSVLDQIERMLDAWVSASAPPSPELEQLVAWLGECAEGRLMFAALEIQPMNEERKQEYEEAVRYVLLLLSGADSADFNFLINTLSLTKGNLSSHINQLEEAGYVEVTETFDDKIPHTSYRLTELGRSRLDGYWQAIDQIRESARG